MFRGQMPDITAAQIVAVVGNVIAVAVAFGVSISHQQQDAVLALAGALGAILIVGDSHLRGRRVVAHATIQAASIAAQTPTAPPLQEAPPAPTNGGAPVESAPAAEETAPAPVAAPAGGVPTALLGQ